MPPTTRARWIEHVPDLAAEGRLADAPKYQTVAEVSEATGYSTNTILDLLSRDPITRRTNPQKPLSRPAARIGTTALYSHKQVAASVALQRAQGGLHLGGLHAPLPKLTATESDKLGHLSIVEVAHRAGVHEQTIRKLIKRDAKFPKPIALRERDKGSHSGVPFVVWASAEVEKYYAENDTENDGE